MKTKKTKNYSSLKEASFDDVLKNVGGNSKFSAPNSIDDIGLKNSVVKRGLTFLQAGLGKVNLQPDKEADVIEFIVKLLKLKKSQLIQIVNALKSNSQQVIDKTGTNNSTDTFNNSRMKKNKF